jgi:hypothetical protein
MVFFEIEERSATILRPVNKNIIHYINLYNNDIQK